MVKRICAALIIGAAVFSTGQAFADDLNRLIGKKVDNVRPLYIDGERSPQDVLIIQGRSYLPVRSALSMFGYEVDYKDGNVTVDKIKEPQNEEQKAPPQQEKPKENTNQPPVYYGIITEEMIDWEMEYLKMHEEVYSNIINSLSQSASYSSNTNRELQDYYTKLSNIKTELQYWESIKKLLKTRPELY